MKPPCLILRAQPGHVMVLGVEGQGMLLAMQTEMSTSSVTLLPGEHVCKAVQVRSAELVVTERPQLEAFAQKALICVSLSAQL